MQQRKNLRAKGANYEGGITVNFLGAEEARQCHKARNDRSLKYSRRHVSP